MNGISSQVSHHAERQRGAVARWQLVGRPKQIEVALRPLRRVFRGVYATVELDEQGWFMAAALAMGETGAVSHLSALHLLGLRPYEPGDIHVSFTAGGNRAPREGLIPHRRRAIETGLWDGTIPVTSPTQSLKDADLPPYALYRALEEAERHGYHLTLPLNDVVRLRQAVHGRTRSDAEAQLLVLCQQHGIPLPLVNHRLNGIEADFHWPASRVVLEVDGWDFHKDRAQFEEDRRRELVHAAAGWRVIRASGRQVMTQPELVVGALQTTGW